jgi:hypothetical protein
MQKLNNIIQKQKPGAHFVISAPMLGMEVSAFDELVQTWQTQGADGFHIHGIPFRKVIDGQFFIQRVTLVRTAS